MDLEKNEEIKNTQSEQGEQQVQAKNQSHNEALQKCEKELTEWKDNYVRLSADFQNFKKRLEKEQASLKRMIQARILLDVINIADDFDRALVESGQSEKNTAQIKGFKLIQKELYKLLEKYKVTPIESYAEFNPELHEAIMHVQSDKHEPGNIVEVLQKGYMLEDHVLRPAKVSVAQ